MNPVVEELNELMHIGVKRRSGRYPWGSGKDPYQHGRDFLGRIEELKKQGWTETAENVRKEFGEEMTLSRYREEKSRARADRRMLQVETAKRMRDKEGLSNTEIGRQMGVNESTVRSWFNEESEARMRAAQHTADFLREQVDQKGMVDVGGSVNIELGVSPEKMNQALSILKEEGYVVYGNRIQQVTNKGQWTTQKVLCVPGTEHSEIYDHPENIKTVTEYHSHDGGKTFNSFQYPASMDSKRMRVRYADEAGPDGVTGEQKDGLVEIRRGVDDLSLGNSHYSQVRIMVDGTHYIKGMAVYSDNLPDGVDVMFNTNKAAGTPLTKVLKPIKDDPDNPFGSLIKPNGQSTYFDADGNEKLSLINKRADEGDWEDWKNAVPSQFLSKQPTSLIKKQLDLAIADKVDEYNEICALTNPTVKKHLLEKFADGCDSAAVHLQAAALPGQQYHVMIPINSLKDNEVFAPNYPNGSKVALIRYPHGGTFEIPILTVNNKHKPALDVLGNDVIDAIGVNKKNADRLSGADFDGDTVMVIPTQDASGRTRVNVKSTKMTGAFERLIDFDPKAEYPETPGMTYMTKKGTQREMGVISNLITDMTLAGANPTDLTNAVRHSMVVIDAEKHKLNYKQSELDHNIDALKQKYQAKANGKYGGAATLISKAKGEERVPKRQGSPRVNIKGKEWYDPSKPEGALVYKLADDAYYPTRKYNKETGEMTIATSKGKVTYKVSDEVARDYYEPVKRINEKTGAIEYTNKDGSIKYKVKTRTQTSTKMAEVNDAYDLVSDITNPKETAYANYANKMKSLANQARMAVVSAGKIEYRASSKAAYQDEVNSLMAKLNKAKLNAPRERQAQRLANAEINSKIKAAKDRGETLDAGDIKKESQRALTKYRNQVGSIARRDRSIKITDREWDAIQAGAISEARLKDILNNTDVDSLRERATPRASTTLSSSKVARLKAMSASGYTNTEIAEKLGISASSVAKYVKGGNE